MIGSERFGAVRRGFPTVIGVCLALLFVVDSGKAAAQGAQPPGSSKVLGVLSSISQTMKASRYQHGTVVRPAQGEYYFDCSGMAGWVLRRGAPLALRSMGRPRGGRPLAMDYHQHISRIPHGTKRGPWYRVPDAASARPGDVISWVRPPWFPSRSTGHVAFIVSAPQLNSGGVPGYLYRVADASRYHHQDDTRGEGQTGFGIGVLLLATDPGGQPIGYGWYGSETPPDWITPTKIAIGRPLR